MFWTMRETNSNSNNYINVLVSLIPLTINISPKSNFKNLNFKISSRTSNQYFSKIIRFSKNLNNKNNNNILKKQSLKIINSLLSDNPRYNSIYIIEQKSIFCSKVQRLNARDRTPYLCNITIIIIPPFVGDFDVFIIHRRFSINERRDEVVKCNLFAALRSPMALQRSSRGYDIVGTDVPSSVPFENRDTVKLRGHGRIYPLFADRWRPATGKKK